MNPNAAPARIDEAWEVIGEWDVPEPASQAGTDEEWEVIGEWDVDEAPTMGMPTDAEIRSWEDQPGYSQVFGAGVDSMQAQFQKTGALIAEKFGAQDLAGDWMKAAEANELAAAENHYEAPHGDSGLDQFKNMTDPEWWTKTLVETIPGSAPFLTGAIGGAAVAAPLGPVGMLIGAAVGGGGTAFAQEMGSAYYAFLETNPEDEEGAMDYAIEKSGLTGVINAASIPLGLAGRSLTPMKYTLFQALGIQPGVGVVDTVSANKVRQEIDPDQPLSQGVAASYAGEALFEGPATTKVAVQTMAEKATQENDGAIALSDQDVQSFESETPEANASSPDGIDHSTGEVISREEFEDYEQTQATAQALDSGQGVDLTEGDGVPVSDEPLSPPVQEQTPEVAVPPVMEEQPVAPPPESPQRQMEGIEMPTEPVQEAIAESTDVDIAAQEAATSPENDLPQPTEAQIEAGCLPG